MPTKHSYGYIPDLRDFRDHIYDASFRGMSAGQLPTSVDLRSQCPPIEDQGQLGSCTSFAGGAAIRFDRIKQGLPDFVTSHLFLYYNSRSKNTKTVDAGATIRDMIKAAATYGDCPETEWAYDISQFALKPPVQAYKDALKDRALSYQRVKQDLTQMQACLASGCPIVIGISVYDSFESEEVAKTGIVPMPTKSESLLGGHCMLLVGYDSTRQWFTTRNSWGASFGDQGYVYIPYEYLLDSQLSSDFWIVKTVG